MSFLYYLPGENAGLLAENWIATRDRHGLGETLADVRSSRQFVVRDVLNRGPDGGSGAIVAALRSDGEAPDRVGYYPAEQTWAKTFGSAWIGYATLPTPTWLLRFGDTRSGLPTLDSLDRRWLIPVARRPGGKELGESLPTQSVFDENAKATKVVHVDARELWHLSGRVWDTFNGVTDDPLTDEELDSVALKALAWNYRIGPAEANAFANGDSPIFDTDTTQRFFLSLIAWDTLASRAIRAAGEGRTPQGNDQPPTGSTSSTGSPDEIQTGDQVEAS